MAKKKETVKKIPTGVRGFDEITHGGVPKGRTTLISGTSGSGKTVLTMQVLYNGVIEFGENAVFITFEETPKDIIKNMNSFGWDLQSLIDQKKFAFVDASPDENQEVQVGEYDLEAFILRLKHAIGKVNARRIGLDSVSALFPRYEDPAVIRRELYRVAAALKELGMTTLLTAERPSEDSDQIARFGVEEFVSDNVILLHNRLEGDDRVRSVEILKFRGTTHDTTEAPLIVDKTGVHVYPRPKPRFGGKSSVQKISTGIIGLDEMMYGGMYKTSTTLVTGASGTGKTITALHFIVDGAAKGEKGLMLAFEESDEQIYRNAESFGWPLRDYVKKGLVKLICAYPEEKKSEEHFRAIRDVVLETGIKRFVIDSLSGIERIYSPEKFRQFTVGLNAFLKENGITSLMTNTSTSLLEMRTITETHLSTTTDNIIMLKYVELGGGITRAISVLKTRGTDHDKMLREFVISGKGITIGEPFEDVENLMSGSARRVRISFDDETDAEKAFLKESTEGRI